MTCETLEDIDCPNLALVCGPHLIQALCRNLAIIMALVMSLDSRDPLLQLLQRRVSPGNRRADQAPGQGGMAE
jgi:hypothetical protein